jgi:hypothetical protein
MSEQDKWKKSIWKKLLKPYGLERGETSNLKKVEWRFKVLPRQVSGETVD